MGYLNNKNQTTTILQDYFIQQHIQLSTYTIKSSEICLHIYQLHFHMVAISADKIQSKVSKSNEKSNYINKFRNDYLIDFQSIHEHLQCYGKYITQQVLYTVSGYLQEAEFYFLGNIFYILL